MEVSFKKASWTFCSLIQKSLAVFVLTASGPIAGALSGSLTDPDLAGQKAKADFFQGALRMRLIRNSQIPQNRTDLWDLNHAYSLPGAAVMTADLTVSHDLNTLLSSFTDTGSSSSSRLRAFFEKSRVFASVDYNRGVYPTAEDVRKKCWQSVFCIGDVSLGLSGPPILKTEKLKISPSFFVNVSSSRRSLLSHTLGGPGALMSLDWLLISGPAVHLFFTSSHVAEANVYWDENANKDKTAYNNMFWLINKPGFRLKYFGSGARFVPILHVYGSHLVALNAKLRRYYYATLSLSAVWRVKQRFNIAGGLRWMDEIAPENTGKRIIANRNDARKTHIHIGLSYDF